jgi:hypothetical protein
VKSYRTAPDIPVNNSIHIPCRFAVFHLR